ncbi:MAG: hypothetical protein GF350_14950 [Chitinivibrionales bacterium]|nr:hypothetical protein [Chitinivibrionales bacterium]
MCAPSSLKSGDATLLKGIPRNFEVFDPLDFLAEVVQHIPNKGEHQIRYYGFYSNMKRGMQEKKSLKAELLPGMLEPDTSYRKSCRLTPVQARGRLWAALVRYVFEVDPLKCPSCGGTMKIVSLIEEPPVIEKILRHCKLWKDASPRPPPDERVGTPVLVTESQLDYDLLSLRSAA